MKLELTINGTPFLLDLAHDKAQLPELHVRSGDPVSAVLCGAEILRGRYCLSVGADPDVRATGFVADGSVTFKAFSDNRWDAEFRLFQGILGQSELVLSFDEDGLTNRRISSIPVYVDNKKQAAKYDEMVKELTSRNRPHFICDNFLWSMRRNKFSLDWEQGYASYRDPEVELRVTNRFLRQLQRPLLGVLMHPKVGLKRCQVIGSVPSVRKISAPIRKGLEKKFLRMGSATIDEISNQHVVTTKSIITYRDKAHRVICGMLQVLLGRYAAITSRLNEKYNQLIREKTIEVDALVEHTDAAKNKKISLEAQIKKRLEGVERLLESARMAEDRIRQLLSSRIMRENMDGLTVFDVEPAAFSATNSYHRLYGLFLNFCRTRFWWVSDNANRKYLLPRLVVSEDGESRLQRKYSVVYENWVYAKLVDAFVEAGMKFSVGEELTNREGSYCEFDQGNVLVRVCHGGIKVKKKHVGTNEFFRLKAAHKSSATPDLFIFVLNRRSGKSHWIVLDAKSDGIVRRHMVQTRCDYACIERRVTAGGDDWRSIEQSWLIYSGEDVRDGLAGIEVPPTSATPRYVGGMLGQDDYDDHSTDDYKWVIGRGIVGVPDSADPVYHGHVRVNVLSIKAQNVLLDFAIGQISSVL